MNTFKESLSFIPAAPNCPRPGTVPACFSWEAVWVRDMLEQLSNEEGWESSTKGDGLWAATLGKIILLMIPKYISFLDFWSVCIENAIINLWLVDDGEIFFEVNFALTTYNTKLRIIWRQATTLNYCNTRIRFKQGLLQGGQLNVQNAAFSNKNRHNAKIITYLAKRKRNFTFSAKLSRIIIYGNKVRATWSI